MVGRTTTREEDIAYSMVGLFGITMTPFYGEGLRAFARLQEILLSSSAMEESFFAWKMPTANAGDQNNDSSQRWKSDKWGLLAPLPEWFAGSADVTTFIDLPPRRGLFKKGAEWCHSTCRKKSVHYQSCIMVFSGCNWSRARYSSGNSAVLLHSTSCQEDIE